MGLTFGPISNIGREKDILLFPNDRVDTRGHTAVPDDSGCIFRKVECPLFLFNRITGPHATAKLLSILTLIHIRRNPALDVPRLAVILEHPESAINAIPVLQRLMRALLFDPALFENENLVGMPKRRKPVRDDD